MCFWKRHNLPSRVGLTKMSVLPSNFEVFEDTYISVAAKMILKHKVPSDLVYGQDEINAQFLSRPNKIKRLKEQREYGFLVFDLKTKNNRNFHIKRNRRRGWYPPDYFCREDKEMRASKHSTCKYFLRPY